MAPEQDSSNNGKTTWIAVVTALIGVVGTYIATSGSTHQKELELQQAKLGVEQERYKTAEERRDRYMGEIKQHEARVKTLAALPHWSLVFENDCTEYLNLAVAYTSLDGEEVVTGWWVYEPGEKAPVIDTAGRDYRFYAIDTKKRIWGGSQNLKVDEGNTFYYLLNREFEAGWYPLRNEKTVGFKESHISKDVYGDEEIKLTCP